MSILAGAASEHAVTNVVLAGALLRGFSEEFLIVFGLIWGLFLVGIEVVTAATAVFIRIVRTPCLDMPKNAAPKPNNRMQATPLACCSSFHLQSES